MHYCAVYCFLWTHGARRSGVAEHLRPHGLVYYCVDDYTANPGVDAVALRRFEQQLVSASDVTLVTAEALAKRLSPWTHSLHLLPQAVDTDLFLRDTSRDEHPVLAALDQIPRPRVGYLGNLATYKIDLELVKAIADRRPEWSIVLIGPRDQGDVANTVATAALPPNVHLLEAVPHALTPATIDRFDVCLLPSADHEVIRASFPLKFFEYLLRGRPVVSRPLPALASHRAWYREAYTALEFVEAIEADKL